MNYAKRSGRAQVPPSPLRFNKPSSATSEEPKIDSEAFRLVSVATREIERNAKFQLVKVRTCFLGAAEDSQTRHFIEPSPPQR